MTPSPTDTDLFLVINHFAQRTTWLHAPLKLYAEYGIVLFAGLLVVGWLVARREGLAQMSALIWAGLGMVVAVTVNQPLVQLFHEARSPVHPPAPDPRACPSLDGLRLSQ